MNNLIKSILWIILATSCTNRQTGNGTLTETNFPSQTDSTVIQMVETDSLQTKGSDTLQTALDTTFVIEASPETVQRLTEEGLTRDRLWTLFRYIPDSPRNLESIPALPEGQSAFSHRLDSIIRHTQDIPSNSFDGPDNYYDCLQFYIWGMGTEYIQLVSAKVVPQTEDTVNVKIIIKIQDYGVDDGYWKHDLILIREKGKWVLDNFGIGPEYYAQYIENQRKYFRSAEWKDYVERTRIEDSAYVSAQQIEERLKEVEEYFRKYPD